MALLVPMDTVHSKEMQSITLKTTSHSRDVTKMQFLRPDLETRQSKELPSEMPVHRRCGGVHRQTKTKRPNQIQILGI